MAEVQNRPIIPLVQEAPALPDLEQAAFEWSADQISAFDASCAEHSALIASDPYRAGLATWNEFLRAQGLSIDNGRGAKKAWFRDLVADLRLPTSYPPTFAEQRRAAGDESHIVRGKRVCLTADLVTLDQIVERVREVVEPEPLRLVQSRSDVAPQTITSSEFAAWLCEENHTEAYRGCTTMAEIAATEQRLRAEGRECTACWCTLPVAGATCPECGLKSKLQRDWAQRVVAAATG